MAGAEKYVAKEDPTETYMTKERPTLEDWIAFNSGLFAKLRGEPVEATVRYSTFEDVDMYAAEAGLSTEEYFAQIVSKVGSLGLAYLKLQYSEMDGSRYVSVVLPEEET